MTIARLLLFAAALAMTAAPLSAADDPADAQSTARAKEYYQRAQTHYALGEFTEAVNEFREAYRLRNSSAILFNIAQAMRQLSNYKQAYFYYSQYLSKRPDAPNRSEVEGFMEAIRKKVEADQEAERARSQAEAARPPLPRSPDDHLAEGEAGEQSAAAKAGAAGGAKGAATPAIRSPCGSRPPVKADTSPSTTTT